MVYEPLPLSVSDGPAAQIARLEQRVRELEQALKERHQLDAEAHLYRLIACQLPGVAIALFDCEMRYLMADGPILENLGFSSAGLEGKTIWEALPPTLAAVLYPHYQRALQGESSALQHEYHGRMHEIRLSPIYDEEHQIVGGVVITADVTEQIQAAATLRDSQAQFVAFLDNLPAIAFLKDEQHTVTYVNAEFERYYGPGWVGRNSADFPLASSADMQALYQDDEQALAGEVLLRLKETRDRHGEVHFMRTLKFPVPRPGKPPLVGGIAVDTTDQRRSEIEALLLRDLTHSFGQTLDFERLSAMIMQAVQDLLPNASQSVLHLLQPETGELQPVWVHGVYTPAEYVVQMTAGRGLAGLALAGQQDIYVPDVLCDERYLALPQPAQSPAALRTLMVLPLLHQGAAIGVLSVGSQMVNAFSQADQLLLNRLAFSAGMALSNARLYEELKQAVQQEQKLRDQLVRARHQDAMARLAASVAHDLNNPLQTISNTLFLLKGSLPVETETAELFAIARFEVERMTGLISQLRQTYQAESLKRQPVDLQVLMDWLHLVLKPNIKLCPLDWQQTPIPSSLRVLGSAGQLLQVFINLSMNALEAMRDQAERSLQITWQLLAAERLIGISFQDNGPGIEAALQGKVFEPYFSTKEQGMGLGLSLCSEIVRQHGGSLDLHSVPGQGACLTVWLPLADSPNPADGTLPELDK